MRTKKIGTWIARLLITMLTFMGLGQTMVHAVEVENGDTEDVITSVVLTKLQSGAEARDLTLEEIINGVPLGDGVKTIPNVSFNYYKISPDDLNENGELTGTLPATPTGTVKTGSDGTVTFNLGEGVYWFEEVALGTIVSSSAVPFALTLPYTNQEGTGWLETVHVYPKNVLAGLPEDPEKSVNKDEVAIGELNTWTILMNIPVGIEDYAKFDFIDEIDSRLDFENNVLVSATGATLVDTNDYIVTFDDASGQTGQYGNLAGKPLTGTLKVSFTEDGRAKLAAADPKKVEIKFDTKVNKTAIMGQDIYNNVVVDYDNGNGDDGKNQPVTPPFVNTGGKAFLKQDGKTKVGLKGAEFKIQNIQGQFVKRAENGDITFEADTDNEPATVFTSGDDGSFEVRGLPYGSYVLIETKAPQGYALPTDPNIDFQVDANSYYAPGTEIDSWEDGSNNVELIDNRALVIPQTGGMGTVLFTVVGAVMMLFSALFYKRTKEA